MNVTSLIKTLVINGAFAAAGYYVHKNAVPGEIAWKIAGVALTVAWLARIAVRLTAGYKKVKAKAGGTVSLKNIDQVGAATLPDWMLGYYNTEKKIYRHAWRALTFAPIHAQGGFSTYVPPANGIKAVLLSIVLAVLGAWGATSLLASLGSGTTGVIGAVALVALSVYLIAWIIGDWRASKEGAHQLVDGALQLKLGVRSAVTVPLDAIACCTVSEVPATTGTADDAAVLKLSATASTNVLIELRSHQNLSITRFGYPVSMNTRQIALQLANPHEFIEAITQKLQASDERLSA
jgi:hypothetical protein